MADNRNPYCQIRQWNFSNEQSYYKLLTEQVRFYKHKIAMMEQYVEFMFPGNDYDPHEVKTIREMLVEAVEASKIELYDYQSRVEDAITNRSTLVCKECEDVYQ